MGKRSQEDKKKRKEEEKMEKERKTEGKEEILSSFFEMYIEWPWKYS